MFAYKPRGEILAIHHLQDLEGKVMDKPQPWIVRLPALLPHPSSPPPYPYLVWSAVSDLKFPGLCVYTERPGEQDGGECEEEPRTVRPGWEQKQKETTSR